MKKTTILLTLALCLGSMAFAQESNNKAYEITVGDTIVWQPFDACDNIGYSLTNPKVINFSLVGFGDRVQIVGLQVGTSNVSAKCGDITACAIVNVNEPYAEPVPEAKPEKPQTLAFTSTYRFNPPTDHFFITFTDPGNHCRETWAKIGNEEAYNNGHGTDRWWSTKTGENWYFVPEFQGWTDDVRWEFEAFTDQSFFPMNAFPREVNTNGDLSQYYVGMERVLDVNCWVFFVEIEGDVVRYWVDPSNGCTLKRQVNLQEPQVAVVYDLNYTRWYFGPKFKKAGLHDTRR